MKRVLTICLILVMLMTLCVGITAATGGFMVSPSGNAAPDLVEATNESEDCEAIIYVVSYAERNLLLDEDRQKLEEAYSIIRNANDITTLCSPLAYLAGKLNLDPGKLAVSDMFDINYVCGEHDNHGKFEIVLKSTTFENFVALLHYTGETWELMEDAKVEMVDGELHLTFTAHNFSPFAVVVDTTVADEPANDNEVLINTYLVIIALILLAIVLFAIII